MRRVCAVGSYVAIATVVVAGGCSADDTHRDNALADAGTDTGGVDASSGCAVAPPGVCGPSDLSAFTPPPFVPPSGAQQGKCTPDLIEAFLSDCLRVSTATKASCDPFVGANADAAHKACVGCLISMDTASSWAPIVQSPKTIALNTSGCIALVDPSGLACAKAYQANERCEAAACAASCTCTDVSSCSLYGGCVTEADGCACRPYAQNAAQCAQAEQGRARSCFPTDFETGYRFMADLFCGGPPPIPDASIGPCPYDAGGFVGWLAFASIQFTPDAQPSASFNASFGTDPGCCTVASYGACIASDCVAFSGAAYIGAGALTITGGSLPDGGVTIEYEGGAYASNKLPFAPGDTLGVSASGGQVPAFAQTVVAPGRIAVTQPVATNGTFAIATSQDLLVSWTGGEAGAQVVFEAFVAPGKITTCTFDAAAGQGTIPKASLAHFAGGSGGLYWVQQRTTSFEAGSFPLTLQATQEAFGSASFQ